MFFREKKSGDRTYLQIVENRWEQGGSKQRVLTTLGRLDKLNESGAIDSLLRSGSRFAQALMVISAHKRGEAPATSTKLIGPVLVFERLWEETGCKAVLENLLDGRKFGFNVERALFLTVLHRLIESGSDRQAEIWKEKYKINGAVDLSLHHLYRAMGWLGEPLPKKKQKNGNGFMPRLNKDVIEENLFYRRRTLFTSLDLVFFDTTSIYFEGEGGESIGQYGKSKDHRSDRKQMIVVAVIDDQGRPICCETWPGNKTDVTSLIPVADRLKKRFKIGRICVVADRGMISAKNISELEKHGWGYILGVRMRNLKEASTEVLSRAGRYEVVHPKGSKAKDPSPLKVKEVEVDGRHYVVCLNEDQAKKDAADRKIIVESLREKLKEGGKSLIGNKGYRKYLKKVGKGFEIDEKKMIEEARYDGKWVLRHNTDLGASDAALKYKELWMVEDLFRRIKSILSTRPIYHKCDETIIGHVFCSFLALVLMKELQERVARKGYNLEWQDVIRDLNELEEILLEQDGKRFLLRSESKGVCGKVFQAAGVAVPPTVRQLDNEECDE